MKGKGKNSVVLFSFCLATLAGLIFTSLPLFNQAENLPENYKPEKSATEEISKEKITMGLVGDIMLDRRVLQRSKEAGNPKHPFKKSVDELNSYDLLFGNLESMISDQGKDVGGEYSFRAPPKMIEGLPWAGFDVLSVANNHSLDWGGPALTDTVDRLRKEEIIPVGGGLSPYEPVFLEVEDLKVAFLAQTDLGAPGWRPGPNSPGVAMYDEQEMIKNLKLAKEKADLTVFSIHFGIEYETEPTAEQREISKTAIDHGADVVAGHHPHVIQPVEEYKDGIIAYSLGNFVFDQDFSEETMEGLVLELEVDPEKERVVDYEKRKVNLNEVFQPVMD